MASWLFTKQIEESRLGIQRAGNEPGFRAPLHSGPLFCSCRELRTKIRYVLVHKTTVFHCLKKGNLEAAKIVIRSHLWKVHLPFVSFFS